MDGLSMNVEDSTAKPLSGCTVMVTRACHQADGLANLLAPLGAEVILQPAIEIVEPGSWGRFDAAIKRFSGFSRVVLVSANAARFFFSRLNDPRSPQVTATAVSYTHLTLPTKA